VLIDKLAHPKRPKGHSTSELNVKKAEHENRVRLLGLSNLKVQTK
jgi:hypothetical protein